MIDANYKFMLAILEFLKNHDSVEKKAIFLLPENLSSWDILLGDDSFTLGEHMMKLYMHQQIRRNETTTIIWAEQGEYLMSILLKEA